MYSSSAQSKNIIENFIFDEIRGIISAPLDETHHGDISYVDFDNWEDLRYRKSPSRKPAGFLLTALQARSELVSELSVIYASDDFFKRLLEMRIHTVIRFGGG